MIKVFDKEEFVKEEFEMEVEYLEQFGLEDVWEGREGIELYIWFQDFNSNEQRSAFIDNGDIQFLTIYLYISKSF